MSTSMDDPKVKRVKVKREYPTNLYFAHLLEKMLNEAKEKGKNSHFTYAKALKSLRKYPLELKSAWDGKSLEGFGDGICRILDQSLKRYTDSHGQLTMDAAKNVGRKELNQRDPQLDSSLEHRGPLLHPSEPFSEKNICTTDTLLPLSKRMAPTLVSTKNNLPPDSSLERNGQSDVVFELKPEEFEIRLVVDWSESGISDIKKVGLDFDRRRLAAADFVWIARHKRFVEKELLLNYVIERKRLDDLAKSICENRYRDQKVRLRECGIPNRIFLIEWNDKCFSRLAVPIDTLKQAMLNTQVHEKFYLKVTKDPADTALYLQSMTEKLQQKYGRKTLVPKASCKAPDLDANVLGLMPFVEFQDTAAKSKPLTVQELFARQLMVVRGMTIEKANAIVSTFPTFLTLLQAYQNCIDGKQKISLLAELTFGDENKKLGSALSLSVVQFFEAII